MREIELSSGDIALVDDDAPEAVFQIKWCKAIYKSGLVYVRGRFSKKYGGHGKVVFMHRLIMGEPDCSDGAIVDHINGNGLDNRRANLQMVTHSRNTMRSPKKRGGVTKLHNSDRWRARMRVDGSMISLGCYDTKQEAAAVVKRARKVVWSSPEINKLGAKL